MLIGLWIYDELSFNKYHQNYDRIGELWTGKTDVQTSAIIGSTATPYPVTTILREKYPQYFKRVLRAWWLNNYTLTLDGEKLTRYGQFIEGDGIEMLSLKMLSGGNESLKDPHSIILSRSTAESIFGKGDFIGKTFTINALNGLEQVTITGVYEDIPSNNDFASAQFFAPWSLMELSNPWWIKESQNDWNSKNFKTYVELNEDVDFEKVNAAIVDIFRKNSPQDFFRIVENSKPFVQIIPMSTRHLYSEFENGKPASGELYLSGCLVSWAALCFYWLVSILSISALPVQRNAPGKLEYAKQLGQKDTS
ncbi:MAG: ABC transporter permease [Bacteroidota bacterium]